MDRDKVEARAIELLDSNHKYYTFRGEIMPGFLAWELMVEFETVTNDEDIYSGYRKLAMMIASSYRPKKGK